jgi:carboxyl-terminal processing protease
VLLVVAVSLAGCGGTGGEEGGRRPLSTAVPRKLSPREYLTEVEDVIQDHAYYADRVDWATWEASVPDIVAGADDASDTYSEVRSLLAQLDPHSGLAPPAAAPGRSPTPDRLPDSEEPVGSVDDGIGRFALPLAHWDPEDPLGAQYVSMAWDLLADPACGWIVDLRAGGGNAWTLVMALAPLLGPGPAFGFAFPGGKTEIVSIRDDGSLAGGGRPHVASPAGDAMPGDLATAPVAIVQSHETASAHEFAVMAFSGRPLSRTFGTSTSGLPTAREGFEMKDGSVLYLTTALGVDAGRTAHDAALPPNQQVTHTRPRPPPPDDTDAALDAARSWLTTHSSCN